MDSPVAEGLSELRWSEPVIFDRLRDAYSRNVSDAPTAWRLARLHARVWRALISGETGSFQKLRGELIEALAEQGLRSRMPRGRRFGDDDRTAGNRDRSLSTFPARRQGLSPRADGVGGSADHGAGGVSARSEPADRAGSSLRGAKRRSNPGAASTQPLVARCARSSKCATC